MRSRLRLAWSLILCLAGGCASPVRLLEAPRAEAPAAAVVAAVDIRIWDRFGRRSLPLRSASEAVTARARKRLAAQIPLPPCAPPASTSAPALDETLALYQRVATVWLAERDAGRAGLGIGPGLEAIAGDCDTALILLGQQLEQREESASWLALGAVNVADGRLLRLAAMALRPEDDLRRPQDLNQRIDQLVDRVYR